MKVPPHRGGTATELTVGLTAEPAAGSAGDGATVPVVVWAEGGPRRTGGVVTGGGAVMGDVHGVDGAEVCNAPSSAGGAGTIGTTWESEPIAGNPSAVEAVVGGGVGVTVEVAVEADGEVEVEVLGGFEAATVTAVGTVWTTGTVRAVGTLGIVGTVPIIGFVLTVGMVVGGMVVAVVAGVVVGVVTGVATEPAVIPEVAGGPGVVVTAVADPGDAAVGEAEVPDAAFGKPPSAADAGDTGGPPAIAGAGVTGIALAAGAASATDTAGAAAVTAGTLPVLDAANAVCSLSPSRAAEPRVIASRPDVAAADRR